jgi:hypothetical protein
MKIRKNSDQYGVSFKVYMSTYFQVVLEALSGVTHVLIITYVYVAKFAGLSGHVDVGKHTHI